MNRDLVWLPTGDIPLHQIPVHSGWLYSRRKQAAEWFPNIRKTLEAIPFDQRSNFSHFAIEAAPEFEEPKIKRPKPKHDKNTFVTTEHGALGLVVEIAWSAFDYEWRYRFGGIWYRESELTYVGSRQMVPWTAEELER